MYLWLGLGLSAASLAGVVWVFMRPVIRVSAYSGDAHGKALWLRLLGPWVDALAPACMPLMSWRMRQRASRRLALAGLDRDWSCASFLALQVTLGGLALLLTMGVFVGMLAADFVMAVGLALAVGGLVAWLPVRWLIRVGRARQQQMLRELPFMLDMTTLCVEAGLNLQGALQKAASHGPDGPLRHELRHALADMRAGAARMDALGRMVERTELPALASLVSALGQADRMGVSLGPLLRAQSEMRRSERFLRAERLALQAPVKMLFPMVFCIFPCTFLMLGFPIVVHLLDAAT